MSTLLLALSVVISSAFAQPVGQSFSGFRLCARELFRSDDFTGAYKFILGDAGASEISVVELQEVLRAGKGNPKNFFILRETGSVRRGQLQSALKQVEEIAFSKLKTKEIIRFASAVIEELIQQATVQTKNFNTAIKKKTSIKPRGRTKLSLEIVRHIAFSSKHLLVMIERDYAYRLSELRKKKKFAQYIGGYNSMAANSQAEKFLQVQGGTVNLWFLFTDENLYTQRILETSNTDVSIEKESGGNIKFSRPQFGFNFKNGVAAISDDGEAVVAFTGSEFAYTWTVSQKQRGPYFPLPLPVPLDTYYVSRVAFLPKTKLALIESRQEMFLWDLEKPELDAKELPFKISGSWAIAERSDKMAMASPKFILLRSLPSFDEIGQIPFDGPAKLTSIEISPNGKYVGALISQSNFITLWNTKTRTFETKIEFEDQLSSFKFLPNSKQILVNTIRNKAWLVDIKAHLEEQE